MGDMTAGWYDEGECGPPTMEDDAWYTHAVVSLGYPKVKRGDVPMAGQMTFTENPICRHSWPATSGHGPFRTHYCDEWTNHSSDHRCVCGEKHGRE